MKIHIKTIYLLCIFLIAIPHKAGSKELVIGLGNFEPLFSEPDKPALFKDLIDGVYTYIPGVKIQYRYMLSNARLVTELNNGKIHGAANVFSESEINGCLTDPTFSYSDVAITVKATGLIIKDLKDLSQLSVVSYQGAKTLLGDKYKNAVIGSKYYKEVAQPKDQAILLSRGLVDASIGDKYIFLNTILSMNKPDIVANDFLIHNIFPPVATSMGFSDQEDCDEFNSALKQYKSSGKYLKVYQNHLTRLGYTN